MPEQAPIIDRPPSEYFIGRCFLTAEPDEKMVPYIFDAVAPEIVCYSSDYCHWDCDFPDSVQIFEKRDDIRTDIKKNLFSGNAAKLYGFDVPA